MHREHYFCTACEAFDFDPIEREVWEHGGEGPRRTLALICPRCGSEQLDERMPCVECSEFPATRDDWCASCYAAGVASGNIYELEERP